LNFRRISFGISILVSSLLLSGLVISLSQAEGSHESIDWYTQQPQLFKNFDYTGGAPVVGDRDGCEQTNVQVSRSLISKPYESYCMVPTSMGLIERNGAVVQPQGYTTAYPIQYVRGGNPVIIPVRNQPSAFILSGYSQGPGVTLDLFKQLSNHLEFKLKVNGSQYYDIAGQNQFPDYSFRYSGGSTMVFGGGWSFSENGRYTVIDVLGTGMTRIDMMNLTMQPFANSLPKTSGGSLLGATTRISEDGRTAVVAYNAPADWGSKYFKMVDVDSCTNAMPAAANTNPYTPDLANSCRTVDLFPYMKTVIPTLLSVEEVKFGNGHTINLVVKYQGANNTVKYASYTLLANGYQKTIKEYLALGDSYISGEGAHSYRVGTDSMRNQCHQSLASYPYLLSNTFSSFASIACSGAKLQNITHVRDDLIKQLIGSFVTDQEEDYSRENYIPGAILQTEFVKSDNPEAVTVSIGGNDIGFGRIMEKCVHPMKNSEENQDSGHTCYSTYEDRSELVKLINNQFTKWRSLYESLKNNGAEGRRVYVIGYPQVAKVGGNCGLNVLMNAEEVKFSNQLIAYLNTVIERAAREAGVQYVDTQQAFNGHRLCEAPAGQAAMNGFTITQNVSGGYDFKASYHPNQLGHRMLADAIAAQTSDLTKPMPIAIQKTNEIAFDANLDILQDIPKTYRPERYIHILDSNRSPMVYRTQDVNELLLGKDYFIKPGSTYTMELHSEPYNLGTVTANDNGDLQVYAVIPRQVELGFHTLHIYGNDIFGNLIDIQKVIFVAATGGDIDNDGPPNHADS